MRPFLFNLFSDRTIIRLGPPFLQKPLARLISGLRSSKTEDMYRQIGGKSPILDITRDQAKALEEALNSSSRQDSSLSYRVYVGMRYWHPFIEDTLKEIHNDGVKAVVGLSLYPHYSAATTGSAVSRFDEIIKQYPMDSFCISSWYNYPQYIDALVDGIRRGLASFQDIKGEVLFSAHSLPMSIVERGDPYVSHIRGTIEEVEKRVDIRWHLSYQSKSGPVRWLEPSTGDKIRELAGKGVKNLLIVPISFVSDHIETLYEIDILYKRIADGLGIRLERMESLNIQPLFIRALENLVTGAIKERGWTE